MGKSFVFKGLSGRPGGYIMQAPGVLRIRTKGIAGKSARLTAVYADGKERTFGVEPGEAEAEKPDAGGQLAAAYVTVDDELVLHTGDAARKAFEQNRRQARMAAYLREEEAARAPASGEPSGEARSTATAKEKEGIAPEASAAGATGGAPAERRECKGKPVHAASVQSAAIACADESGGESGGHAGLDSAHPGCAMPERRWPPPPCLMRARYVCGHWAEG